MSHNNGTRHHNISSHRFCVTGSSRRKKTCWGFERLMTVFLFYPPLLHGACPQNNTARQVRLTGPRAPEKLLAEGGGRGVFQPVLPFVAPLSQSKGLKGSEILSTCHLNIPLLMILDVFKIEIKVMANFSTIYLVSARYSSLCCNY